MVDGHIGGLDFSSTRTFLSIKPVLFIKRLIFQVMIGRYHPLTQFIQTITAYFIGIGFEVMEGPEIETEQNNFDFLEVPADHPVRDVQDTFWLAQPANSLLLRTHTTAIQAHLGHNRQPPMRIITPGRVFRNEATDATHQSQLYQIDGLVIDQEVSLANLVATLESFLKYLFGKEVGLRFVPHHYPFVEPGMDAHIKWAPKGRWLEVLGSGMMHPEVIKNMGYDPETWRGLAFGMGVDRLMLLYYGIDDIRHSLQNDFRFLRQF